MFAAPKPLIRAIHNISLDLEEGSSLGIVGESGCGKSTLARSIVGIAAPTSGEIYYRGRPITGLRGSARRELFSKMQFVFQDPLSSLNPRKTVRQILEAPLIALLGMDEGNRKLRIAEVLERVNMSPESLNRHPHEFSGGQAQRIGIARALASGPELLILDEPVSALDVSIQAQILALLLSLKRDLGLTYLFISHDLAVVNHLCNEVAVMYLGSIAEYGSSQQIFNAPRHPYTATLLASVPEHWAKKQQTLPPIGELPDPANPPAGCPFVTRCYQAEELCHTTVPVLEEYEEGHHAACHFADKETVFRTRS